MADKTPEFYGKRLSRMIQQETISAKHQTDKKKFYEFHNILRELFPTLFSLCTFEDFDGSFMLIWKGSTDADSVMFMNHHDVVEASGDWKYPPFSGEIAEGKVWGRGTLDTKGGLFCMLQAAEELALEGFIPPRDTYFVSACTEECDSEGAYMISQELQKRGVRFSLVLDEGGMILHDPIGGADGTFAMVGLGEKGWADLKFVARSAGGHASLPGKNTPLVRLGKFMAAVEKKKLFKADISPALCKMFEKLASTMGQPLKFILGHPKFFKPLLKKVMPMVSDAAGAMLGTTLAFTMAGGSEGANVLPQEAWVIGNMRYSHHQGRDDSIAAVRKLAEKYDIETIVLDAGTPSPLTDHNCAALKLLEKAVSVTFPGVITTPYLMNGASDSRFMSQVSDQCLRFVPFSITDEQLGSIHGINENVDLKALPLAVSFYKYMLQEA